MINKVNLVIRNLDIKIINVIKFTLGLELNVY